MNYRSITIACAGALLLSACANPTDNMTPAQKQVYMECDFEAQKVAMPIRDLSTSVSTRVNLLHQCLNMKRAQGLY